MGGVNVVVPGPVRASLFCAANPPGHPITRKPMHGILAEFIGAPEDSAHAAPFFTSDAARIIAGQARFVGGGTIRCIEPEGRPDLTHLCATAFPDLQS